MTKRTIDYINGYRGDIEVVNYENSIEQPKPGDVYVINRYKLWRARFKNRPEPALFDDLNDWESMYVIEDRSPEPAIFYRVP